MQPSCECLVGQLGGKFLLWSVSTLTVSTVSILQSVSRVRINI